MNLQQWLHQASVKEKIQLAYHASLPVSHLDELALMQRTLRRYSAPMDIVMASRKVTPSRTIDLQPLLKSINYRPVAPTSAAM